MKITHLESWLSEAYTHCQYGSKEWCEGYLNNALETIRRYENALIEIRDSPFRSPQALRSYAARTLAGEDRRG